MSTRSTPRPQCAGRSRTTRPYPWPSLSDFAAHFRIGLIRKASWSCTARGTVIRVETSRTALKNYADSSHPSLRLPGPDVKRSPRKAPVSANAKTKKQTRKRNSCVNRQDATTRIPQSNVLASAQNALTLLPLRSPQPANREGPLAPVNGPRDADARSAILVCLPIRFPLLTS